METGMVKKPYAVLTLALLASSSLAENVPDAEGLRGIKLSDVCGYFPAYIYIDEQRDLKLSSTIYDLMVDMNKRSDYQFPLPAPNCSVYFKFEVNALKTNWAGFVYTYSLNAYAMNGSIILSSGAQKIKDINIYEERGVGISPNREHFETTLTKQAQLAFFSLQLGWIFTR